MRSKIDLGRRLSVGEGGFPSALSGAGHSAQSPADGLCGSRGDFEDDLSHDRGLFL